MKRFILLSLLLCACEAPREAWDMPNTYTPNPANNPATIVLPSPGDMVAAGVVDQAIKDTIDRDSRKLDKLSGGTVSGDLVTSGAVTIGGTGVFIVDSGVSEEHDNTPGFINGATFSTAGTVSCSVPSTFSDTATFTDAVEAIHATGPVQIDGANGQLFVGGNGAEFGAPVICDDSVSFASKGKIQFRDVFPSGTANQTYFDTTSNLVDSVIISGSTGAHDFNFKNTGAKVGFHVKLAVSGNSGFTHSVKRDDGTVILSLVDDGASGSPWAGEIVHDGSNWRLIQQSINP